MNVNVIFLSVMYSIYAILTCFIITQQNKIITETVDRNKELTVDLLEKMKKEIKLKHIAMEGIIKKENRSVTLEKIERELFK